MSYPETKQAYFPNLDGLRFIGSLAIILFHIEGIKGRYGQQVIHWIRYFSIDGDQAVSMFFVLSGFLITYLLLKEKQQTGNIGLKKFYMRRILKIWPLYYFIGLIGYFILPALAPYFYNSYSAYVQPHFWRNFLLYLAFIPPRISMPAIGAAWSVRVEEAFYLVWPWLLKWFRNYYTVFLAVVIGVIVLRNTTMYGAHHLHIYIFTPLQHILRDYRVSCMAFGGLGAYLYIEKKDKILALLYRKSVQWAIYAITLGMLVLKINIPIVNFEAYAFLFAVIVLNLATNPRSVVRLDYGWMNYLGKISYGLYLYNPIMRIICMEGIMHYFNSNISGWKLNLLFYVLTIGSTILVSVVSYMLFEKQFLKLKKYFYPPVASKLKA